MEIMSDTCIFTMANDFYLDGCMVMIYSFLTTNKNYNGDIIVFCDDVFLTLSEESIKKLKSISDKIHVKKINSEQYKDAIENIKTLGANENLKSTLLKFEMFKNEYKYKYKCWIDSDMVVKDDISAFLYSKNFSICNDKSGIDKYYNSGIFCVDTDCFVVDNPFELLLLISKICKKEFFVKKGTWHGKLPDQDVINEMLGLLVKRITVFEGKIWNLQQQERDEEIVNKAKVIHYLGAYKPFINGENGHYKTHSVYNQYRDMLYEFFENLEKNGNTDN